MSGRRHLSSVVARLPKTRAALEYAERQHAGQHRISDGAPFMEHPLEVGWLLYRAGASDHVIAAGVLHDTLEKTPATPAELTASFGPAIAELVDVVSEDETIPEYRRRKAALRQQVAAASPEALMVFAADKVAKVRELRSAISAATQRDLQLQESLFRPRRLAHLQHCLGMLEARLGDSPLVEQLRIELAGLVGDLTRFAAPASR